MAFWKHRKVWMSQNRAKPAGIDLENRAGITLCPIGQISRLQSSLKMTFESRKAGAGQALECTGLAWDGSSGEHWSQQGGWGAAGASASHSMHCPSLRPASLFPFCCSTTPSPLLLVGCHRSFSPSLYCILPSLSHVFHVSAFPLLFSLPFTTCAL